VPQRSSALSSFANFQAVRISHHGCARLQLFCQLDGHAQLIPHTLQHADLEAERCSLVAPLDGHMHGPDCGHETVPHDDHVDYLVRAGAPDRHPDCGP
jgi:hypothetical protein